MLFGEDSRQTHGVYFNSSGGYALGTGYYYDNNKIDVTPLACSTRLLLLASFTTIRFLNW